MEHLIRVFKLVINSNHDYYNFFLLENYLQDFNILGLILFVIGIIYILKNIDGLVFHLSL